MNKEIYIDGRRAPTLNIHGSSYSFHTAGDTGTGTAFANLISFDVSLLELTCLPALAHDLPLLKNIENAAMENIISIYSRSTKQIFIAIDKLSSYDQRAADIIEAHKVLQLSKDKLLLLRIGKRINFFVPNLTPPDVTERLLQINPSLAREARKVLDMNKSERHIREGWLRERNIFINMGKGIWSSGTKKCAG